MRSTSLLSLFGFALCLSAAVAACSGDDDDDTAPAQTPSDLGQSCTRTADCKSGLVCIDQVCEKKGTVPNAGSGNEGSGGSTGGTTATGGTSGKGGASGKGGGAGTSSTPPPVLGSEGESCTRAADCAMGLKCFNQRCTRSEANGAGGEGGMGTTEPPTPRLGAKGETCVVSTDCDTGLVCRPSSTAGAVGVCTIANTGITPTGKDCHAECREADDCCQLPTSLLTDDFKSCADLKDNLSGIDCSDPGAFESMCFVYATYCDCAPDAWKCTDGACEYVAECKSSGSTTEGCPSESRSGRPLVTSCNDGHCQLAATDPTCTTDARCVDKGVADDVSDHCTADECTCYKPAGLCYRKCSVDVDCQPGKVCDAKAHVCMPAPQCSTDVDCQASMHNINTKCDASGICRTLCASDLECNPNLTGALTQVCNSDRVCEEIGCTQDSECQSTGGSPSVQLFCTTKLTAEQTGGPSSAITDGTK